MSETNKYLTEIIIIEDKTIILTIEGLYSLIVWQILTHRAI